MVRRILIAPLDWGLGHATRCIPIIRKLLSLGHDVRIAGSGPSLELLKKEFPHLAAVTLPGYNPVYPKKNGMVGIMALQLPKFAAAIIREQRLVNEYVLATSVDIIISDNRYGCWSASVTSVFITHQSNILMPKRFGWLAPIVRSINGYFMRRFDICWIPDHPDQSLAGSLISFGEKKFHPRIGYLGNLSRFQFRKSDKIDFDLLAICSGPEPQRSMLEEILTSQLESSGKRYLLVRGVIGAADEPGKIGFMTSKALEDAIIRSEIVISRSGYSSVMDMSVLGKRTIFIPTPGQTEQEYLAKRLLEKGICFSMNQETFDLTKALRESERYPGFSPRAESDLLDESIESMIRFQRE